MNNKGFSFLSEEELRSYFADFRMVLKSAFVTDYAKLLGVCSRISKKDYNSYGYWWLRDIDSNSNNASFVDYNGHIEKASVSNTVCGIRPTIKYSLIKPYCEMEHSYNSKYKLVSFGEYPSMVLDNNYAESLETVRIVQPSINLYKDYYTFLDFDGKKYSIKHIPAFNYSATKYIRFVPQNTSSSVLNDGRKIVPKKYYWLRVSPVKWLVDEENDIAISLNVILGGIPFIGTDKEIDFDHSFIKMFLDTYFAKEIVSNNKEYKNTFLDSLEGNEKKVDAYGLDLGKVTEKDIIKGAIESDISVFLHGRSSDGKSARVKELDPDCEIIYMRNATPDSLNGKSVYDGSTGKMIDVPPSWYKKIVDKCNSEPDKIHIVFFDELTNALPSMQGMAFNIILDREVNGKWKLPKNARIVAAGNDLQDSLAANKMAEPLFNRFAHVYINTGVEEWLEWAMMDKAEHQRLDYEEFECEEKIHPAIISYIEEKHKAGVNVLRTPYNGEKPNADPRKWEMASRLLYKTGKIKMLRALVGETLTYDLSEFLIVKSDKRHNLEEAVDKINNKTLKKGKSI